MDLTPLEIQQKEFKKVFRGLDPEEVSSFLQQVSEIISTLLKELDTLKSELRQKSNTISDFKEREGLLKSTILSAQQTAEQMKANAQKQAGIIISEAEVRAEKIVTNAHHKLVEIQEEMEELKRQKTVFQSKLKGMIETHLKLLELESGEETEAKGKLSLFNPPLEKS